MSRKIQSGLKNITYFKELLERRKILLAFILALGAACFVFPTFFEVPAFPIDPGASAWSSLDPSWRLALNHANIHDLTWGRDLTITYGPLSFLSTRLGWGAGRFAFLYFDLFVALNFFFLFYRCYLKSSSRLVACVAIVTTVICLPVYFGAGTSLVLLAFLIFWITDGLNTISYVSYLLQILLLLLLFFIKFNTGLVSFVFFYAGLLYHLLKFPGKRKQLLVTGLVPVAAVPLCCLLLHVALADYIRGGLEMVSGYNAIMYMDGGFVKELCGALAIMLIAFLVFAFRTFRDKEERLHNLLSAFIMLASVFVLYKQSFVRKDQHHVSDFYKYIPLFFLAAHSFYGSWKWKYTLILLLPVILASFYFAGIQNMTFRFGKVNTSTTLPGYWKGFAEFTDTSGLKLYSEASLLPAHVRSKIGQRTIDSYPWNVHMLIANRLNYHPRPVPQSYTAYTPYLEELNFEFYNSSRAPDFVLYEFKAIDGRYPLFDEPKLNLVLQRNYSCVDTFSIGPRQALLLEKKPDAKKVVFKTVREFDIDLSEEFLPAPGSYYELSISHSFPGACYSFLKHAPALSLMITTKDGAAHAYKTSAKLLASGVFSQRFFGSTSDFRKSFGSDSISEAQQVKFYKLQPRNADWFKSRVKVREVKIE